jgi:large subunit ribosomal protein L29
MKNEEIKGKSNDELKTQSLQLRKEAFNLRFQKASGQLTNTARIRQVRRDIARIESAMTTRGKTAAPAAKKPAKAKAK